MMPHVRWLALMIVLAVAIGMLFTGCDDVLVFLDGAESAGDSTVGDTPPLALMPAPVIRQAGQEFVFSLESNPTTGYSWEFADSSSPDVVELLYQEFLPPEVTDPPIVGAPGTDQWTFAAINPGDTALRFLYKRPWESEAQGTGVVVVIVRPIQAAQDEEFSITLGSNASTGFGWQLAEELDAGILVFLGAEYVAPPPVDPPIAGVPGKEVWTFQAIGIGQTSVSLEYVQPWDADAPPAGERLFSIKVTQ